MEDDRSRGLPEQSKRASRKKKALSYDWACLLENTDQARDEAQ
jgi:hypothetical protein